MPSLLAAKLQEIWGDGSIRGVSHRSDEGFCSLSKDTPSELLGINRDAHVCFIHPHDDDPILGVGFLMMDLRSAGHRISMIQVTDGSLGWAERTDADNIVKDRYEATVESLEAFGVDIDRDLRLLGFPDGSLSRHAGITFSPGSPHELSGVLAGLVTALRELRPDVVVFTSRSDIHPDHIAVADEVPWAIIQASEGIWRPLGQPIRSPKVFQYAVYSSLGSPQDGEVNIYHPRGVDFTMAAMEPFLRSQEAQITGILNHLSKPFSSSTKLRFGDFQRLLPLQPVQRAEVETEIGAAGFLTQVRAFA